MKAVVVDASVALRWLLDETEAQRLDRDSAEELYERLTELPITFWPTAELIARARTASFACDLTLFDALYVALSERSGYPLATADQGIVAALQRAGKPELIFPI